MDGHSHSRRNLLTGEWILVSPNRTGRPWQGQLEPADPEQRPAHDETCYLCPGNRRVSGVRNPDYRGTFVFDNDFPALSADSSVESLRAGLFRRRPESGHCRVICYTGRHDERLSTMSLPDVERAIRTMTDEFVALDRDDGIAYVQVFENRGLMMGCSNPHPHAQLWATSHLPNEAAKEFAAQAAWLADSGSPLLADYLRAELDDGTRLVYANDTFAAVVPFWAIWPFETLVLPRREFSAPDDMLPDEIRGLAACLRAVLGGYDRLFGVAAPYSMGFHPRPSDGATHPEWIYHAHVYPPLLRSASVRKHFVGFEMLAMPQRDLTPERAAEKLRENIDA